MELPQVSQEIAIEREFKCKSCSHYNSGLCEFEEIKVWIPQKIILEQETCPKCSKCGGKEHVNGECVFVSMWGAEIKLSEIKDDQKKMSFNGLPKGKCCGNS